MQKVTHKVILGLLLGLVVAAPTHAVSKALVVHGIPGGDVDPDLDPALPVDIAINGDCAITDFTFGEIIGPVDLEAGVYDFAISLSDPKLPGCSLPPVIEANDVELIDGSAYAIVAHLTADGGLTASVFDLDLSSPRARPRVIAHHTAAAPTVDIILSRGMSPNSPTLVLEGVSNGDQGSVQVLPGRWRVMITPAGEHDVVFGPAKLLFKPFIVYTAFAVGSLENETFDVLVKPIPVFPGFFDNPEE